MSPGWLSARQIGKKFGLSEFLVRKLVNKYKIRHFRISQQKTTLRIDPDAFERFLEQHTIGDSGIGDSSN